MKISIVLTLSLILIVASDSDCSTTKCFTSALQNLLVDEMTQRKENSEEPTLPTVTPFSSLSSDFNAEGICGKIWTDAGGTCCKQSEIKNRADVLIEKLQKRMSARYNALNKGNDKLLNKLEDIATKIKSSKSTLLSNGVSESHQDTWTTLIDTFRETSSQHQSEKADALNSMKTCMKAISEYRIKTWCLSCAGIDGDVLATDGFYLNSRVIISESVCQDLTDKCGKVMAYFRKIRSVDLIMRQLRKGIKGNDKEGVTSDLGFSKLAIFESEQECASDISSCKSNKTKRNSFCNNFFMNVDDDELWGDGKLLEVNLEEITGRLLSATGSTQIKMKKQNRILDTLTYSYGIALVGEHGLDMTALSANYQVSEDQFKEQSYATILNINVVLALLYFYF